MYHYLKGKPVMKLENAVVLDVNDVGYLHYATPDKGK